jgi:thymidylate synthase (FAD)
MEDLDRNIFIAALQSMESTYIGLTTIGWKPQQARAILPNSLKTELVMTGFISDWEHFFSLRTPNNAHPQARELAIPLMEEFRKMNYL